MLSSKNTNFESIKNDPDRLLDIFCPPNDKNNINNKDNNNNTNAIAIIGKQAPLPPIKSKSSSTATLTNQENDNDYNNEKKDDNGDINKTNEVVVAGNDNEDEKKKILDFYSKIFLERTLKAKKKVLHPSDLVGFEKDLKSDKYKNIEEFFNSTICEHCIKHLEKSYNHCLNKVRFFFPSVYEVNEDKDCEPIISSPEVYIHDGEIKRERNYPCDTYITNKKNLENDKQLTYNTKIMRMREGGPGMGVGGYYGVDVTKQGVEEPYPGIIFHDLESKLTKEIQKLNRTILILKDQLQDEKDINKDYRKALEKMRKSCLFADTWKNLEESRLRTDILNMRTQLTGFISYSFSQEREKYELRMKNENLQNEMKMKEEEIVRVNKNYDMAQLRFKEITDKYAELSNSVKDWKEAAKNGSQEVQLQNKILNDSLKKLANECTASQNRLINESERAKNLEFELMAITSQYQSLEKEKEDLKNVIQDYIKKYTDLKKIYQDSLNHNEELKENINNLKTKIESSEESFLKEKSKASNNITEITKSLDDCKKEKEIIQLRMEEYLSSLEKVTLDYGKVMSDKCRLEDELVFLKKKHKSNLAAKTRVITELEKKEEELKERLNHYMSENNRLHSVENELRLELDKGNVSVNVLKFDLNQTQNTLEDIKLKLSDKISKLLTSNNSLQEENRVLSTQVTNLSKKTEDDEKYIEILKKKLATFEEKNEIKNAIYNTHKIEMYIEEKIAETEEANIESIKKIENLNEQIEITEVTLQKTEEERAQLEEECQKLKEQIIVIQQEPVEIKEVKKEMTVKINECKEEIDDLKQELEETKTKNNVVTLQFNNYKVNMEHDLEFKKNEINRLLQQISEMTKEADESRKVLDKIYESYESSKTTLEQLLLNNELLKSELINKQKQLLAKDDEFREFNKTKQIADRNYFSLIKLEKQGRTSVYNDLLTMQVQLKQEANRIEKVLNIYEASKESYSDSVSTISS